MTVEEKNQKKEYNSVMIEIASTLNDSKKYATAKEMWDKMTLMRGGDQNVIRAKENNLRGKYDDMRMKESENIV